MNTKSLRGAAVSLAAVAVGGAMLGLTVLPRGVASADNEDQLYWLPDPNEYTQTSYKADLFGDAQVTGDGALDGYASPFETTPVYSDELLANVSITGNTLLGYEFETYNITGGDAAIPTGSVIDQSLFNVFDENFGAVTVEVPGAGLFGLPEITDTFFTPLGDFSI